MKSKLIRIIIPILMLWMGVGMICCNVSSSRDCPSSPVVILFENDVHCAVDGYARLATLKERWKDSTSFVTTVSCGDFIQGGVIGLLSNGEYIVDIMNQVGYDVVALGNHEFNYGISQTFKLAELLDASVVNANFRNLQSGNLPFAPYKMVKYGDVDIAFLGLTTTTTTTSVSPKMFQDEEGNLMYNFSQSDFYQNAQKYVDAAREEGADYVIVLSHLGDRDRGEHASSVSLIRQTTGIDVVLDGHEHRLISDSLIQNRDGNPVLLSSAGENFQHVGVLTLSTEGLFNSRLIPMENIQPKPSISSWVNRLKEQVLSDGERIVGVNEVHLSINDSKGTRIVRSEETNIGNFCADALRVMLQTDVAMVNSGGIRADLFPGEISYNDLLSVFPFNNEVCTAFMTGQQILDALEFSVRLLPEEDGSFMQVSGIRFEVDYHVPTPVVLNKEHLFSHVSDKARRIKNLEIFDSASNDFQPVDLSREYTIASFDYLITKLGDSGVLRYAKLKEELMGQDIEILSNYIERELDGRIGTQYAKSEGRIQIFDNKSKVK